MGEMDQRRHREPNYVPFLSQLINKKPIIVSIGILLLVIIFIFSILIYVKQSPYVYIYMGLFFLFLTISLRSKQPYPFRAIMFNLAIVFLVFYGAEDYFSGWYLLGKN